MRRGVVTLQRGIVTLRRGVVTLRKGVVTLRKGVVTLRKGVVTLRRGVVTLRRVIVTERTKAYKKRGGIVASPLAVFAVLCDRFYLASILNLMLLTCLYCCEVAPKTDFTYFFTFWATGTKPVRAL